MMAGAPDDGDDDDDDDDDNDDVDDEINKWHQKTRTFKLSKYTNFNFTVFSINTQHFRSPRGVHDSVSSVIMDCCNSRCNF